MRKFIVLFLFISSIYALDDALIETINGPKSSHDLIEEAHPIAAEEQPMGTVENGKILHDDIGALPSPDAVISPGVKVVGVPSETHAGRPIVLDKPNISPTIVPEKSGLPSENVAPANSKAESIALEGARKKRDTSSSKSSEEKEEGTSVKVAKIPTEVIAVAHKNPGEETKIATATKATIIAVAESGKREKRAPDSSSSESHEVHAPIISPGLPVVNIAPNHLPAALGSGLRMTRDASKSAESDEKEAAESIKVGSEGNVESVAVGITEAPQEEKKGGSSYTTKIPIESAAVAKKKFGEEKTEVATATKFEVKNITGSPSDANLPTISIDKFETTTKSFKLAKIPTEEIAVAHKKIGEEAEVATVTKASIVAIENENKEELTRVKKHSEPNSKSNESGEEESAQSPSSPVINKDEIKETAIAVVKPGEKEPEIAAVATIPIHSEGSRVRRDEKQHRPGPNEDDMAAGDPEKLEAKPKTRARRYAKV